MCVSSKGLLYVPDFITPQDEASLIKSLNHRWTELSARRLQFFGGTGEFFFFFLFFFFILLSLNNRV